MIQQDYDAMPVWVLQVRWPYVGRWEPWSIIGRTREQAMERAKKYFVDNGISFALGNRTQFGFSRRVRFRKYYPKKESK